MDVSPEPTVIARTLKDFHQFISSGKKTGESCLGASTIKRLNFSSVLEEDAGPDLEGPRKRQLESIAGFDITKKFREKDSEIVVSRAKISRLEGRVCDLELSSKKVKLETEAEVEVLRRKQLRDKELIEDLQHKLRQLQSRKYEAQEAAGRMRSECSVNSLDAETKMIRMQRDHLEQSDRLHEEIASLREKVLNLEREASESSSKVTLAESHSEELEQELARAKQKWKESVVDQLQSKTLTLQLGQAQAKIKELEIRQEEMESLEKKADLFRVTVQKLPVLKNEVASLKEENDFLRRTAMNTELLEERVTSTEQKLVLMQKRCEQNAELQAEMDLYKDTLDSYEAIIKEELELEHMATPQELKCHLARLKQGDQVLTDGIAQLRASHKSLEDSRTSEEAQLALLKSKLERQHRNTQQNAHLIKRLQRKLTLVTKERDGLKDILTSYESEVTINHSVISQERIGKLEIQLESYKQELQHLEGDLEASHANKIEETSVAQQRREDAEKISSLEKKVSELEGAVAKLTHEKDVLELRLEHRALQGDYDPTKTRVLHFKNNPLLKATENRGTEIQRLQEENEALRERVRLLERGETEDITERVGVRVADEAHAGREVSELREKIVSLKTRNKRLMEAFKRKSLDMREVVYRLTGYRVDASGDSHYKLINMYAESAEDYFLFEQTPKKELQLLDTEFSSTLEDLIDAYLHHENSFPAFLSAVTLDLFNKQNADPPHSSSDAEEEEEEEDDEGGAGAGAEPEVLRVEDDDLVILD